MPHFKTGIEAKIYKLNELSHLVDLRLENVLKVNQELKHFDYVCFIFVIFAQFLMFLKLSNIFNRLEKLIESNQFCCAVDSVLPEIVCCHNNL